MPESHFERVQEDEAAAEAAKIGGRPSDDPSPTDPDTGDRDPAMEPVREAGGGEAEGFEEAERELIEHASHGDQHAARRVIEDAPDGSEDERAASGGEADEEEQPDL
jgi:hypothetical protein